jgi:hypothetical protein
MTKSFAPVVSPAIVSGALKAFKDSHGKLNKVMASIASDRSKAVNQVLDAMVIACDKPKAEFMKGNAATNAARFQVKAMFDAIVEAGHLESATGKSYQTAFWIAFQTGVAWSSDLNNKKTADKQADKQASEASPKASGAVQSTSRADLDKTLSKAMAQARLLGLTEFAAELVDLCIDRLDGFTETVLAK